MVALWQILFYMLLAILAIFIFRLMLHLLVILLSNCKNRTLKLRVAEDYDFIEGWNAEEKNNSNDSGNDNYEVIYNEVSIKN